MAPTPPAHSQSAPRRRRDPGLARSGLPLALTGRTIARLAGLSHAGAGKVLTQLVEHGMVLAEPVGAAYACRLNREHPLVGPALEMPNPLSWVEFDTATFTRMITSSDPRVGELRRDAHRLIAPTPPGPHRPGRSCEVRVSRRASCGPTDARRVHAQLAAMGTSRSVGGQRRWNRYAKAVRV